jgi:peptidoglycan-N-acetylglucosamine deacetylase
MKFISNPPTWLRKLFYSLTWKFEDQPKTIYLTFDDGPTPEVTEWVLKTLDEYKAKATFFCLGRNVEKYPEIHQQVIQSGHAVGNHTYSHLKGWQTDTEEYVNDIHLAAQFINSKLFRPPYGRIHGKQIRQVKEHGYKLFMYDVLPEDYNHKVTPDKSLEITLKYTTNGSIVCFHDSVKASRNLYFVLPRFLKYFSEQGYNFKKLK